jgi:hypothetical protein
MRSLLLIVVLFAGLPLASAASEFDWLVRNFARDSGQSASYIPLFGLLRFAVAVIQPVGTSELRLAVFEHARLDPVRFRDLADQAVGGSWKPMIRVRSRDGESTNIYSQEDGQRLRLLIASLDKEDAIFVQVRVKPQELMKFVDRRGWKH